MKKLIPMLGVLVALVSCQKEPSTSDLENDFVVFTNYDTSINYDTYGTFYVPDSVLLITEEKMATYWTGPNSDQIIDAVISQMEARGYERVMEKGFADLGMQVSYVEDTYYFTNYSDPYWWGAYPGYWAPGYWGGWGSWYYPYSVAYDYSIGSLLVEMADLTTVESSDTKLPVIWNSYLTGLLTGSNKLDLNLTIRAINQAFKQSTYLEADE